MNGLNMQSSVTESMKILILCVALLFSACQTKLALRGGDVEAKNLDTSLTILSKELYWPEVRLNESVNPQFKLNPYMELEWKIEF